MATVNRPGPEEGANAYLSYVERGGDADWRVFRSVAEEIVIPYLETYVTGRGTVDLMFELVLNDAQTASKEARYERGQGRSFAVWLRGLARNRIDGRLLRLIQSGAGNQVAYEAFCAFYRLPLTLWFANQRFVETDDTAQDLADRVLVKVARGRFNSDAGTVMDWLTTIRNNEYRTHYRKMVSQKTREGERLDVDIDDAVVQYDQESVPERIFQTQSMRKYAAASVATFMRALGFTSREIAEHFDSTPGAIDARIFRDRRDTLGPLRAEEDQESESDRDPSGQGRGSNKKGKEVNPE
jgi:DNA-directed RNA polymerase specialized sigma24 family protein